MSVSKAVREFNALEVGDHVAFCAETSFAISRVEKDANGETIRVFGNGPDDEFSVDLAEDITIIPRKDLTEVHRAKYKAKTSAAVAV